MLRIMVKTYRGFFEISRFGGINIFKLLRVAIGEGEPGALYLDHQPMAFFKCVRHIGQRKIDRFNFTGLERLRVFKTVTKLSTHGFCAHQHLVTAHGVCSAHTAIGLRHGIGILKIIREYIAPLIRGGGGGQKTLATAGGQDASRLKEVIEKVKSLL